MNHCEVDAENDDRVTSSFNRPRSALTWGTIMSEPQKPRRLDFIEPQSDILSNSGFYYPSMLAGNNVVEWGLVMPVDCKCDVAVVCPAGIGSFDTDYCLR